MHCYRHPQREAYVRCQRCERYICPDCQIEAAVGFLCPEDAGQSAAGRAASKVIDMAPRKVRAAVRGDRPLVTYTLIAICVVVWGLQLLLGNNFTYSWLYAPVATGTEPWRMLTSAFLHSSQSPLHILFNTYSLWIFGRELEYVLGRGRYLALYLISAFGGSVGVLWLADPATPVLGASGAIFGLMAAYFVVVRSLGGQTGQITGLIAINLVSGFLLQGVAWQAHVGGLITGAAVAWVYSLTRAANAGVRRVVFVGVIVLALVVLTVIGTNKLAIGF